MLYDSLAKVKSIGQQRFVFDIEGGGRGLYGTYVIYVCTYT